MRERHTLTCSTGISHSAGPVLRIERSIRSEIDSISPCVDGLMLIIKKCRCVPGSEIDVEVSLREALANAVVHGNHKDPPKYVYVGCCCLPNQEVFIVVRTKEKDLAAPNSLTRLTQSNLSPRMAAAST